MKTLSAKVFYCICILLCVLSCKKKETDIKMMPQCYLTTSDQTTSNSTLNKTFFYSENKKLSKSTFTYSNSTSYYNTYDASGNLTQSDEGTSSTTYYYYQQGKRTGSKTYLSNGTFLQFDTVIYENKKITVRAYNPSHIPARLTEAFYSPEGNLIALYTTGYDPMSPSVPVTFIDSINYSDFDQRSMPLYQAELHPLDIILAHSKSNPKKTELKLLGAIYMGPLSISTNSVVNSIYTYNEKNNMVTKVDAQKNVGSQDEVITTTQYTYNYCE